LEETGMNLSWLVRFLRMFVRDPAVHWLFATLALGSAGLGLADVVYGFPEAEIYKLVLLAVIAGWLLARFRRIQVVGACFHPVRLSAALIQQASLVLGRWPGCGRDAVLRPLALVGNQPGDLFR
jgi:hypothetical protein